MDTLVVGLVVDRSYSIRTYGLTRPIIDGFNEYVDGLRDQEGETLMSVTFFDTTFEERHVGVSLAKVKALTDESYVPDGNTALYDAIGHTITKVNKLVRSLKRENVKVLIVTLTDGEENSSVKYDAAKLASLVKEYESLGNWTFAYLGFGQTREYVASAAVNGIGYTGDSGYFPGNDGVAVAASFNYLAAGTSALRSSAKGSTKNLMADAGIDVDAVNDEPGKVPPSKPASNTAARIPEPQDDEAAYTESSLLDHLGGR